MSVPGDSLATEGPLSFCGAAREDSEAVVAARRGGTTQERCAAVDPNFPHNYFSAFFVSPSLKDSIYRPQTPETIILVARVWDEVTAMGI